MKTQLLYQSGFENEFVSEAKDGAVPIGRNNPQKAPYGLYAEQINGAAFTAPGRDNQRSWLYRILPSVRHSPFELVKPLTWIPWSGIAKTPTTPNQLRWGSMPKPRGKQDFLTSLFSLCGCGSPEANVGCVVLLYNANQSMDQRVLVNSDADMLIVPQDGKILVITEYGKMELEPGEICVVQRGIKFSVAVLENLARGYVLENYGSHFQLPYRGPIGANGLANSRDFLAPVAWYENKKIEFEIYNRFCGSLFRAYQEHSPFDVVGWHGNYVPYKYDLRLFNTMNTVSFDHPDPSIFTVLTSPSSKPGTANADFVIFPSRWMVAEDTFRPPYFHRNIMSEYMGLIYGVYDAKPAADGFVPGGGSLHNCMTAHGPEAKAFESASAEKLLPVKQENTLAFMFETSMVLKPTEQSLNCSFLQRNYWRCWKDLKSYFKN